MAKRLEENQLVDFGSESIGTLRRSRKREAEFSLSECEFQPENKIRKLSPKPKASDYKTIKSKHKRNSCWF